MASGNQRAFRAKRGDVRLAILSILSKKAFTGYGLMKEIKLRSNDEWRISSGSIYPQLDILVSENLVRGSERGSANGGTEYVYGLTSSGYDHVKKHSASIAKVWDYFKPEPTPTKTNNIEQEIDKLKEVITILLREDPGNQTMIIKTITELRKVYYTMLGNNPIA